MEVCLHKMFISPAFPGRPYRVPFCLVYPLPKHSLLFPNPSVSLSLLLPHTCLHWKKKKWNEAVQRPYRWFLSGWVHQKNSLEQKGSGSGRGQPTISSTVTDLGTHYDWWHQWSAFIHVPFYTRGRKVGFGHLTFLNPYVNPSVNVFSAK